MGKRVKCIDNSAHNFGSRLKIGGVYEVSHTFGSIMGDAGYYYLTGVMTDDGTMIEWSAKRFVDVDSEQSERTTLTDLRVAAQVIDPNIDHEEERCRSVLLGPSKGCCPCNVPLKDCNFHS